MNRHFNDLLLGAGIQPKSVAIVHHHTTERGTPHPTIADLWEKDPAGFKIYHESQSTNRPMLHQRSIWATFVQPSPAAVVFVGLYDATLTDTRAADWICPFRGRTAGEGLPLNLFATSLRAELSEQIGHLRVRWPRENVRSWVRRAEGVDLALIEGSLVPAASDRLHGPALISALERLGFVVHHPTRKIVQLRRGDLIVYAKRDTRTRPLVLHPRFLDLADRIERLDGVDIQHPPGSLIHSNLREFPAYRSPTRVSEGRHGFAVGVTAQALSHLLQFIEAHSRIETKAGTVRVVAPPDKPLTQRERLQAARIGQGEFRNALIAAWDGVCPVTSLDHLSLLRASHIKPWKDATDKERLDPFNGLLLSAQTDALFDSGLISFADDGTMLISRGLSVENRQRLALNPGRAIAGLDSRHAPYLAYHRQHRFNR